MNQCVAKSLAAAAVAAAAAVCLSISCVQAKQLLLHCFTLLHKVVHKVFAVSIFFIVDQSKSPKKYDCVVSRP